MADESLVPAAAAAALTDDSLSDDQIRTLEPDALPGVAVEKRKKFGRPALTVPQIKQRALAVTALMFQGYRVPEIARMMKVSRQTVWRTLKQGKDLGVVQRDTVSDIIHRLEDECLPMALEGLKHHLSKKDKDVVMKTLEGRGVLVNHQSVKTHGTGGPAPTFKITIAQGDNSRVGVMGQVVGAPRENDESSE